MPRASPSSAGPNHEVPPSGTLRTAPPRFTPPQPSPVSPALPSRPTLLPLSFVLVLVALIGFGSAALALGIAYSCVDLHSPAAAVSQPPLVTHATIVEKPGVEPVKEPPPAPNTLAILPFEIQFEPTPSFRQEVEKLNAALPQLLTAEGKLRVKPLTETAPLRYCRAPLAAARDLKVRAVLVVKFTTEPGQNDSICHLELIDVESGFLLWGMEIEAPDGFLKHPERLAEVRQVILQEVPKRMVAQ